VARTDRRGRWGLHGRARHPPGVAGL